MKYSGQNINTEWSEAVEQALSGQSGMEVFHVDCKPGVLYELCKVSPPEIATFSLAELDAKTLLQRTVRYVGKIMVAGTTEDYVNEPSSHIRNFSDQISQCRQYLLDQLVGEKVIEFQLDPKRSSHLSPYVIAMHKDFYLISFKSATTPTPQIGWRACFGFARLVIRNSL